MTFRPRRCGNGSGTVAAVRSRGPRSDRSYGRGRQTSGSPCMGPEPFGRAGALGACKQVVVDEALGALLLQPHPPGGSRRGDIGVVTLSPPAGRGDSLHAFG